MFPVPLKSGDVIGIISPSSPITNKEEGYYARGMDFLLKSGFHVVEGSHVSSGTGKEKASDINDFFREEKIQAIIATQGGDTAEECLPFLDFDLIKKNPKIFMGFSDISVLLNAIFKMTGVITFHGPDLIWGFGKNFGHLVETSFTKMLIQGDKQPVIDHVQFLRGHEMDGRLIGGNLRCFSKLIDTTYFPDLDGGIFFWEEVNSSANEIFKRLKRFEALGIFKKINGMLIGYLHNCGDNARLKAELTEILNAYDFPVAVTSSFGHATENCILPIGGRLTLRGET